jgi:hypothetical protein
MTFNFTSIDCSINFLLNTSMSECDKNLVNVLKSLVDDCNWQNVGNVSDFYANKCYK